jgi:hypothetical protein
MRIVWAYTQGKRTRTEAAAAVPVVGIKKSPKRQKKQCAPYVPQSAVTILEMTGFVHHKKRKVLARRMQLKENVYRGQSRILAASLISLAPVKEI